MDYIKLYIINISVARLLRLNFLDFKVEVSSSTGELKAYQTAVHHFCKIKVYDKGHVEFSGSVHKMWNSLNGIKAPANGEKGYNGNDLTISDINGIGKHLKTLFDCELNQLEFHNVEFGLNLNTTFKVKTFLFGLLMHHGVAYEDTRRQHYWQSVHTQYIMKMYDKGNQYGQLPTLRIELKVIVMNLIKDVGISTFADVNENTMSKAYRLVLTHFDKTLHYDRTIRFKELTRLQKSAISNYSNKLWWLDLEPSKRDRPKNQLNKLTAIHSDNLKHEIRELFTKKCVMINRLSKKAKCVIIKTSCIGLDITQNASKICPVTNIDISMQKDDSTLLSNTGLKHLEKTDNRQFQRIKDIFLTGNLNKFEFDVYSMISKQIRNRFYSHRYQYHKSQTNLFAS